MVVSFLPVHGGPELRIEQFWIQRHIATNIRVLLGGHNLAIDHEDHFRRHPATTKFLILVELSLLRLRPILTTGTKHSDKVKVLLIDPELRRMQVAHFCANYIDWSALPVVFPELREIKLHRLQFRRHVAGWCAIDVESQDQ